MNLLVFTLAVLLFNMSSASSAVPAAAAAAAVPAADKVPHYRPINWWEFRWETLCGFTAGTTSQHTSQPTSIASMSAGVVVTHGAA
jgi:hypothetical protein